MELYKGTPRIKVDDCCKQFYDLNIFPETVEESDKWSTFPGTVLRSVDELRLLFPVIEQDLLRREMAALGLPIDFYAYESLAHYPGVVDPPPETLQMYEDLMGVLAKYLPPGN